jgi:hypothetical protein
MISKWIYTCNRDQEVKDSFASDNQFIETVRRSTRLVEKESRALLDGKYNNNKTRNYKRYEEELNTLQQEIKFDDVFA